MSDPETMRQALVDLAEHGCRHDTNPSMDHHWSIEEWYRYIQGMDESVRMRARKGLGITE